MKSKGISVSDFGRMRDKLSHVSTLFTLQEEIGGKDIEKLKKALEGIKYALDQEIHQVQHKFIKILTNKAEKIYKEENKEVKEKLAEMIKMVDTKEFYKNTLYELVRLSEKISKMIDDNKKVKALLNSICIIAKRSATLAISELDNAFSLPENSGINVLREIVLHDIPADELYESLYEELLKNFGLEEINKCLELHKELEKAHKDIKAKHILISFFDDKISLEQDEYEGLLQDILDSKLRVRLKGYNQSETTQDQDKRKYRKYITNSKNNLGFFYDNIIAGKPLLTVHFEKLVQQFKLNDSDKQTLKKELSMNIDRFYLKFLEKKLNLLKSILNKENASEKHKLAIECLLFDIHNLMIESFSLEEEVQNQLELPRNYLAHGNRLITALYPDIEEIVISQAKKICEAIDWTKSGDDFLKSIEE